MKRFTVFLVLLCIAGSSLDAQVADLTLKSGSQGLYLEHKVAPKEGLYAIGRLYNVNPKYIAIFNNIDLNAGLAIGQMLQIPLTDTNFSQTSYHGTPVYFKTGSGDNLARVANIVNKVPVQKLKDWNGLQTDNITSGTKLIVGFLNSKEMAAVAINNSVKKQVNESTGNRPAEDPARDEAPARDDAAGKVNASLPRAVNDRQPPANSQPVSAVSREASGSPANSDLGYFKNAFELQTKKDAPSRDATVTSGIFKTNSGWQDGKYYMLIDDVATGTIVKVINPVNNKSIYAKVLGEMKGIRQNEGLDIRISNAAASGLGIADTEKFIVRVNY